MAADGSLFGDLRRLRVVDLFAGGGGAALGLRLAGLRCLAHVEWDPDACATLRAAVAAGAIEGDVLDGDVRTVDWTPYAGRADLVWASPPCQAWSTAGKRLGAQDERNGWPWTWAAVDAIRPTWLICENVGGLLHHLSAGHPERTETTHGLFGDVTRSLGPDPMPNPDGCARCYWDGVILPEARRRFAHVDYRLIDCADFGVPQRRERLILVCGPEPYRWPVPTHRDPRLVHAVGRPWVTVREALGIGVEGIATAHGPGERVADRARVDLTDSAARTVPAVMTGPKGGSMIVIEEDTGAGFAARRGPRTPRTVDEPSPPVRAGSGGSGSRLILRSALPQSQREVIPDRPADTLGAGTAGGYRAPYLRERHPGATPADESALTVSGKANTYLHAEDPGARRAGDTLAGSEPWRLDMPSPCVTAVGEMKGSGDGGSPHKLQRASDALYLGAGRRRLTPDECAALQSFPPDWPWRGTKTAIYRQIGNAVPPLLAQRLGQALLGDEAGARGPR